MEQPLDGDSSLLAVQAMSTHLTVRFRTVSRRGPCGALAMTGIPIGLYCACGAYQYPSWRALRAVVDPSLDQLAGRLLISRSRLPAFAGIPSARNKIVFSDVLLQ
jgi:hypothetical protein